MTERLEEIKTRFNAMKELESFKKLAPTDLFFDDLNWLLQQAERVQELEKKLNIATERGAKLAHKNVSYKQALERVLDFYPGVPNAEYIPIEMLFEIKNIARKALEREG